MSDLLTRAEKLIATMKNNKKALLWLRDYEVQKEMSDVDSEDAAFACGFMKGVRSGREKHSEWISVKDRLPERNERVLAYSHVMGDTEAEIQINRGFMLHNKRTDITCWMPLPTPPTESGEMDGD